MWKRTLVRRQPCFSVLIKISERSFVCARYPRYEFSFSFKVLGTRSPFAHILSQMYFLMNDLIFPSFVWYQTHNKKSLYIFWQWQPRNLTMFFSLKFKDLIGQGLKADEWVASISSLLCGKGGGKDMSAQASGPRFECLHEAMKIAKEYAKSKVNN